MALIRNGVSPGVQLPVPASDILSLLRACHQVYEGAHHISWAENAFIFEYEDMTHAFTRRIGAKSFEWIRTLGIETTVNAECIEVNGGTDLEFWLPDVKLSTYLPALYLHGWEGKFEEYYCKREQ